MKTCLFGGSFDPVHEGHLAIAEAAKNCAGLDRVIFLPAACSPFKIDQPMMFPPSMRLAMLQASIAGKEWAEASGLDLGLPPPSWSWRLVDAWHASHPGDMLFWLMGTDQWEALHRWQRYDYLAKKLTFIVYHRDAAPQPRQGVRAIFIPGHHPASSSAIRDALRRHTPLPTGWLHPQVEAIARQYAAMPPSP